MAASEGEAQQRGPMTAGQRLAGKKAAKAARKAAKRGVKAPELEVAEEGLVRAAEWLLEHRGPILGAIVGIAVLGGGGVAYQRHVNSLAAEAAGALGVAFETTHARIVKEGEVEDPASFASKQQTFPTRKARAEKALAQYRSARRERPEDPTAVWAALGEGARLLELQQPGEARKAFALALSRASSPFEKSRALEGLVFGHEAEGKLEEANKRVQELSRLAAGRYKPVADYHLARVQAAKGDLDAARETLTALVDQLKQEGKGEAAPGKLPALQARNPGLLLQAEDRLLELERGGAPRGTPPRARPEAAEAAVIESDVTESKSYEAVQALEAEPGPAATDPPASGTGSDKSAVSKPSAVAEQE